MRPCQVQGREVTPSPPKGLGVCVWVGGWRGGSYRSDKFTWKVLRKKSDNWRGKNTAELIERVCWECLACTLDRLQTRVTSACKQPTRSCRFGNMVLNVNYSSIRQEEKQTWPQWIQRATASLPEPFGCFDQIHSTGSRQTHWFRMEECSL